MTISFKGVPKERIYEMIRDVSKLSEYLPYYLTRKQVAYIRNYLEKEYYFALRLEEQTGHCFSLIELNIPFGELMRVDSKPSMEDIINMGKQKSGIKYHSLGDDKNGSEV